MYLYISIFLKKNCNWAYLYFLCVVCICILVFF